MGDPENPMSPRMAEPFQFGLRHAFLFTTAISLLLAMGRWAGPLLPGFALGILAIGHGHHLATGREPDRRRDLRCRNGRVYLDRPARGPSVSRPRGRSSQHGCATRPSVMS